MIMPNTRPEKPEKSKKKKGKKPVNGEMKNITAEEYTERMVAECYFQGSRMSKSNFINHLQEFGKMKYEEGIKDTKSKFLTKEE